MVTINGNPAEAAGLSLRKYLEQEGYHLHRLAVERNGAIVPQRDYDAVILEEGDVVEVVSFVGGG